MSNRLLVKPNMKGVAIAAVVLLALMVVFGPYKPNTVEAEVEAKVGESKYVKVNLDVTCLNGIEYWVSPKHYTHGGMIAPKWSAGRPHPNICTE